MSQPLPKLDVEVALRIDLDGQSATISGADNHLVVHAESPADLVAAVLAGELPGKYRNLRGPRALGVFADSLDTAGVELEVTGPSGTLLTLGSGQHWRWGRLATGSAHVRPGGMARLRPLLVKPSAGGCGAAGRVPGLWQWEWWSEQSWPAGSDAATDRSRRCKAKA